ncbi:BrnT family toxin [Aerophototrophica crusticola]|uniref:BrnT family toxin n=1 Tax=Aerophototrophica crusticola TaxID=1709002 RepID=A0A858R9Z0_9PROT|nr:BrnT family toxin [Rhodospirillaceae bacterium B3]
MKIDFDPAKSERNLRERGFGFLAAARIFLGHTVERDDTRFDYGERRIHAIGMADGMYLAVIYTWRMAEDGPYRWIISAHIANRKERRKHAAFFP